MIRAGGGDHLEAVGESTRHPVISANANSLADAVEVLVLWVIAIRCEPAFSGS